MLMWSATMQSMAAKLKDRRGQDVIEYAILIGIVAFAAIASVSTISTWLQTTFGNYAATL